LGQPTAAVRSYEWFSSSNTRGSREAKRPCLPCRL
jgi:hypothetical protein